MNLVRLQHAVAVAREGSFASAAAAVPISQPALTKSIQALEREYGFQIFERGRFGARPTARGADFLRLAEEIVHRHRADAQSLRHLSEVGERQVRFAMGAVVAALLLPRLLPGLHRLGARYHVRVESNDVMWSLLRSGQIDFFIGGVPRRPSRGEADHRIVVTKRLGSELGLLTRPDHPLHRASATSGPESYPVAAGSFVRDVDLGRVFPHHPVHGPVIEMDNYDLLAKLALETDFVLLGSTSLPAVRPELGLRTVEGSEVPNLHLDLGIVASPGRPLPDHVNHIVEELAELALS